ncbi:thioredoxin domain-containing protein [Phthorimaea operculella]|nr:thioredoxin domain-containing protein [Phthorimaea operculella]
MSLTVALANAAAAVAAAGQGKKAAQVQLQAELNTDDEWNKFLQRDGLLVIDVYTEWCGPCIGMVGNLKKIKVEIGGDNLHLAVAKADTIECLKRFRNRSEPTWMFIAAGQLVNVIFGANAPLIHRTIEQELHNEELAKKGERERPKRAPHELTPPEQEIADRLAKIAAAKKEKEAAAAEAARLARREARAVKLESHFADVCPALVMPHAQKNLRKISDALEPHGVLVADKLPVVLGKDGAKRLAVEDPAMGSDAAAAALLERPALALLLKKQPEREGEVIEICRRMLFGDGIEVPEGETPKKTVAEELWQDNIPGVFVPADRHQRAAALDLLFPKLVSTLIEPPPPVEPPHVALAFGAWQRRAVLAAAALPKVAPRVLAYGFFVDGNVEEPKLLCKTIDQYEARPEKDYAETIIVMAAVGLAEPELADPNEEIPDGPPKELMALGPLHVSEDYVIGKEECLRLFPPGYNEPEIKPKKAVKKKKKKRAKEETVEGSVDAPPSESLETTEPGTEPEEGEGGEGEENGEENGEEGEEPEEGDEQAVADKATSPPPLTPH